MLKKLFFIAAVVVLSVPLAGAADSPKIGIIDFKTLIDNSVAGDSAKSEIKDKGEALKAELVKSQTDLKKMQETYKRESMLWTEDQRKEKQRSFQIELNDLKKLQLQKAKEFNEFRAELFNELKEKLVTYLEKKAKKEGLSLIIEKRSGEVLYADPAMDITQDIIQQYDEIDKQ